MRFYDSADEVRRRLQNGIILYRGEPVVVLEACSVKGSKTKYGVVIRDCPTGERSWKIPLDDPDLNYRQIRTGFVNYRGEAYRIIRWPQRSVQQSLSRNNCSIERLGEENGRRRRGGVALEVDIVTLTKEQSVVDCMAGRFPSMSEARDMVSEGKVESVAFHYDWCYQRVMGAPAIWYKTRPVGLTLDPKSILKLEPHNMFLKEPLQEIGLRVS